MNENNNYNNGNVTPYKASGNLNAAIGNPQVNINDTMNVNIQNMATNVATTSSVQNNNPNFTPNNVIPAANNNVVPNNNIPNNNVVTHNIQNGTGNNNQYTQNIQPAQMSNPNTSYVNKTYVSADNKPKKKNISLSLGPEFKIGLLIIVILLVFVFLLPMISDFFNGY